MLKRLYRMPLINKPHIFAVLFGALFSGGVMAESLLPSVHIQNLPTLGINHLGTHNYVPADIWGKSNTESLKTLIKDIIQAPLTPAMRDIIGQMMLRQTSPEEALPLTFRMDVLMRLGRFDDVLTLANLVPPTHQTPDVLKLKALALFLSGQAKQACEFMIKTPELTQMAEDMRLSCAVANGDQTGAELIFATRSENNELDETTQILAQKLFVNNEAVFDGKNIKIRHLPLLGALGNHVDWSKIMVPIAHQKMLSDLPSVPLHIRLEMAERNHVNRLDDLYGQVKDDTLENKAVLRAKLYQKIKVGTEDVAIFSAINEYLEMARTDGLFLTLAPVMRPFLDTITPSEAAKEVAFNAVQVYALSDNADLAYAWYQILQKSADESLKMQAVFLEPLMQQLGGGMPKQIDKGLLFCQKNKNPYCASFVDKIGTEADSTNWTEMLNHMAASKRYIPLVQTALQGLISSSRSGEAVLYAIKLWQSNMKVEPNIIAGLSEITPKSLMRRLILERYVYP